MKYDLVIIGGGAAGFFAAITCAEKNPKLKIIILEKSGNVLSKVKISGGGRCNVTNGCFLPKELVKNYPRGSKELIGPFHQFMTGDTMEWYENRGVPLKVEDDNRVFPVSNSSQSIVNCLLKSVQKAGIEVQTNTGVTSISKNENQWLLKTSKEDVLCNKLLISSGSSKQMWHLLERLGHQIETPVPSLFTFNIKDTRIKELMGLSVEKVQVSIKSLGLKSEGPLLITHWGLSGPAILKLSAWGARELNRVNYQFNLKVNWLDLSHSEAKEIVEQQLQLHAKKQLMNSNPFHQLPNRLWKELVQRSRLDQMTWSGLVDKTIDRLTEQLVSFVLPIDGKSTFKDEFVTCGGVQLNEIDFKRFQSKLHSNLFFAGEVLNIDAITGGFNFQAAWTGAYIAGSVLGE